MVRPKAATRRNVYRLLPNQLKLLVCITGRTFPLHQVRSIVLTDAAHIQALGTLPTDDPPAALAGALRINDSDPNNLGCDNNQKRQSRHNLLKVGLSYSRPSEGLQNKNSG